MFKARLAQQEEYIRLRGLRDIFWQTPWWAYLLSAIPILLLIAVGAVQFWYSPMTLTKQLIPTAMPAPESMPTSTPMSTLTAMSTPSPVSTPTSVLTPMPVSTSMPMTMPLTMTTEPTSVPVDRIPFDCLDAKVINSLASSGITQISPDSGPSFMVYCDQSTDGGGWTVFQRRTNGSLDFYQDWNAYKQGFGELESDFWLGNDYLHRLTHGRNQTLLVELIKVYKNGSSALGYAPYRYFSVEGEDNLYRLSVSGYSGMEKPGDSMGINDGEFGYNHNQPFSTLDRDNDPWDYRDCAKYHHGGWWFGRCGYSNLNGRWGVTGDGKSYWSNWNLLPVEVITGTVMMVKER